MSEIYKTCKYLNYVEQLLISVSTITSISVSICVSISALVAVPVGITSSAVGIKICVITAGIKKYKSVLKKKKKKHHKIVPLQRDKLKTIEVLISKV